MSGTATVDRVLHAFQSRKEPIEKYLYLRKLLEDDADDYYRRVAAQEERRGERRPRDSLGLPKLCHEPKAARLLAACPVPLTAQEQVQASSVQAGHSAAGSSRRWSHTTALLRPAGF